MRMTVVLGFLEHMEDARIDPFRAVAREAHVEGDAVRGLESDSLDVAYDSIGVGFEDGLGFVSVFADQTEAKGVGHAIGLKEHHDLADGLLLLPCILDATGSFFSDPLDLKQAARFLGYDAEGVGPEAVDDFFGVGLADPMDQSAGQILPDAIGGSG